MTQDMGEILLVTDVDGTLLDDDGKISKENLDSIDLFRKNGGNFTIATGRGLAMAKPVVDALNLTSPTILFNGAVIYDFSIERRLWFSNLSPAAKVDLKIIAENFPTCGIEILCGDEVYLFTTNDLEENHLRLGNVTPIRCDFNDIPDSNLLKALIIDTPKNIDNIIKFIEINSTIQVHWVRSSDIYYEMLPWNVNKGEGLKRLIEITGDKFVVAVGDFMNDIELIKYADIGIAVDNAEKSVKEAADMIVADNNHNSISEVINIIMKCGGKNGFRIKKTVTN